MIKSINYQANQIASIEISDASDVQSLGDSYGYGSTARVTGQISAEYIYTPNGWISTSSGGSGGGVTIVHVELPGGAWDMTAGEAFAAAQTGLVILVESFAGDGIVGAGPIGIGIDEQNHYLSTTSVSNATYGALTADDYPTVGGDAGG